MRDLHSSYVEIISLIYNKNKVSVLTVNFPNWQASEASETLVGVMNGNRGYMYIAIYMCGM